VVTSPCFPGTIVNSHSSLTPPPPKPNPSCRSLLEFLNAPTIWLNLDQVILQDCDIQGEEVGGLCREEVGPGWEHMLA
jgi:hypothetical protein